MLQCNRKRQKNAERDRGSSGMSGAIYSIKMHRRRSIPEIEVRRSSKYPSSKIRNGFRWRRPPISKSILAGKGGAKELGGITELLRLSESCAAEPDRAQPVLCPVSRSSFKAEHRTCDGLPRVCDLVHMSNIEGCVYLFAFEYVFPLMTSAPALGQPLWRGFLCRETCKTHELCMRILALNPL
jgi:hypothetical protein